MMMNLIPNLNIMENAIKIVKKALIRKMVKIFVNVFLIHHVEIVLLKIM